jgi:hypothetical protein
VIPDRELVPAQSDRQKFLRSLDPPALPKKELLTVKTIDAEITKEQKK